MSTNVTTPTVKLKPSRINYANRTAAILHVIKWVLVAVLLLVAAITVGIAVAVGTDTGSGHIDPATGYMVPDETTGLAVGFALMMAAGYVGGAVVVFALFGFFEHSLRMLARIAHNTTLPEPVYYQTGPGGWESGGMVSPGGPAVVGPHESVGAD